MRVAQCIEAPLQDPGGVEVLVKALIEHLFVEGVETLLVVPQDPGLELMGQLHGIRSVFIWSRSGNRKEESLRLATWLKGHQVDLVHFHLGGTYGWQSRFWSECPITQLARHDITCVSTNHGAFSLFDCVATYRPLWSKIIALPLFWPAKIRQLAHVHWEATVSMNDYHAVRRWFFPMRRKFTQLYHSKLQGDEFSIAESSAHPQVPKSPYILCLGTVGARKGQQYLVDAFLRITKLHPEWRLVIAGRQAHLPTMELIRGLLDQSANADRVILLEDVDDPLARSLLQNAGVFAIPSTGEGLGLSLQEAMYAGCACVGSRVGGIPDLIDHDKTGLLVNPKNPDDLAETLHRLLGDDQLRLDLARCAKQVMIDRQMTASTMTSTYLTLYYKALSCSS